MNYDAISPIDGRYSDESRPLARFFSERALASERVKVELEYLTLLIELGIAPGSVVPDVAFSMERVKTLEKSLGHDVKAVEVFVREALKRKGSSALSPYVHLGLTSEDVNSMAFARLLASALKEVLIPAFERLAMVLSETARREARTQMVARTHGQPAVPTTFGKEVSVFAVRIAERTSVLKSTRPMAKLSGAVGTYASFTLMGKRDWPKIFSDFVSDMGADYARYATQVVPGERLSDILHYVLNINQLMLSLARDLWLYQSLGLVRFTRPGKVSSSTMPQKVNPVDLENAEGQVEVSSALLTLLAYRLQLTRMQRDLSDSVIRRMLGQGLAHSFVACQRLLDSLSSMKVERVTMKAELRRHREVFAEAAQVMMRLDGDESGYEKVKKAIESGRTSSLRKYRRRAGGYLGLAPYLAANCGAEVSRLLRAESRPDPKTKSRARHRNRSS